MDTTVFAWTLFALIALALAALIWVLMKTAWLFAARTTSEQMTRALLVLDEVARAAAHEIQQVLVDGAKASSPDGHLTRDQGAQARRAALASVKSQLGTHGLADVGSAFGLEPTGVDRVLEARIEAAVHRIKITTRPVSDAGTAGDAVPFAA
jgi:hypothetical protein